MANPAVIVDPHDARAYTCAVLEMLDAGLLNKDQLIGDLLGWMSEDDVKGFCKHNLRDDDNDCMIGPVAEEERDPMDDFNYVGNKSHY